MAHRARWLLLCFYGLMMPLFAFTVGDALIRWDWQQGQIICLWALPISIYFFVYLLRQQLRR